MNIINKVLVNSAYIPSGGIHDKWYRMSILGIKSEVGC